MAEDDPRRDPKSPQDARLASFDERLRQAQADEAARTGQTRRVPPKGQAQGMRILSVLFGALVGSTLIGFAIDHMAGTRWVMPLMLFLGIGIAMWEVWKISQQSPK